MSDKKPAAISKKLIQSSTKEIDPDQQEILRSLYYLGKALHRYSQLEKQGVSDEF